MDEICPECDDLCPNCRNELSGDPGDLESLRQNVTVKTFSEFFGGDEIAKDLTDCWNQHLKTYPNPKMKPSEVFLSGEAHLLQKIEITVPIRTVSEANTHEHWAKKHARKKQQRKAIILSLKPYIPISLPCHIILTRISPRRLDEQDNLPMSFKWIFDSICDIIIPGLKPGRADSDERITVEYRQEKRLAKEHAIKIEIQSI